MLACPLAQRRSDLSIRIKKRKNTMKQFHWFALVLIIFIGVSLFLPYETHDYREGNIFDSGTITKKDIHQAGVSILGAYLPIVVFILLSLFIFLWKNTAVAIIGLVGSVLLLVYDVLLAIFLTLSFNLGRGPVNKHVNVGYYLLVFATIGFIALMLINLIITLRNRKNREQRLIPNTDLLDDLLD